MTKTEVLEYLYDNPVRSDITIEEMAEDLSVDSPVQPAQDLPITCTVTFYKQDAVNVLGAERETLYHNRTDYCPNCGADMRRLDHDSC